MLVTDSKRARRTGLRELWDSSIGKKIAVAVSGAILVAYVVLHMLGNLNSLYGPGGGDARVDDYSHWLRDFGEPLLPHAFVLWAIRVLLLAALVIHVTAIVQLRARNRAARGGHQARRIGRTFSSATTMVTGTLLLAFVVFHIMQFTTLTIDVTPLEEGAVYANLYHAFQEWYFVLLYVAAVGALGFHLRHGVWSAFQTLGLDRPERNQQLRRGAGALAVIVVLGFILVPICFWTGVLDAPAEASAQASAVVVNR
ncbi:succinate dehydrogenase cytochrome b subunit [Conexibacter arvalis]|uniref:Succinate dehydrogenase / fumarate reductase cytochrome b subunit n=1 Tax=Conexibacter arvalis TaxID=912552 RepID=A0A840IAR0_9ACTN|nr:succinate dehydrogenase cytochrome b subunit [Conexibacter arvalis]MBB4661712.1 succinate dehydrogenase / fumarate reductase cytochrome b subunit [Conexibacter arvalis]